MERAPRPATRSTGPRLADRWDDFELEQVDAGAIVGSLREIADEVLASKVAESSEGLDQLLWGACAGLGGARGGDHRVAGRYIRAFEPDSVIGRRRANDHTNSLARVKTPTFENGSGFQRILQRAPSDKLDLAAL